MRERFKKIVGSEFDYIAKDDITIRAFIAQADVDIGITIKYLEDEKDAWCLNIKQERNLGVPHLVGKSYEEYLIEILDWIDGCIKEGKMRVMDDPYYKYMDYNKLCYGETCGFNK